MNKDSINNRRIRNILLVLSICILLSASMGCIEDATYPGGSGEIEGAIEIIGGKNHFDSSWAARSYLYQIEYWKAEVPYLDVGEPEFTIVDHSRNYVYQYSSFKATVPFKVHKDAPAGDHRFTITCFDTSGSPLLKVTGTVNVCSSEKAAGLKNGGIMLVIGIVLLVIGFFSLVGGGVSLVGRGEGSIIVGLFCLVCGLVIFVKGAISLFHALF